MRFRRLRVVAAVLALVLSSASVGAQELTVLSSNGIRAVLTEVLPRFERGSGVKVAVTYNVSAELKRHIDAGAAFDLTIMTAGLVDDLAKTGKVTPSSRTTIARSGMALGVRSGSPKPDMRTTPAVVDALRRATSIAVAKEGAGGVFVAQLMRRLKLEEVLAPKLRPYVAGTDVSGALARGDAEMAVLPLSELISVPGVAVAGTFPPDIQDYTVMVAAVGAAARQPEPARRLIEALMTEAATAAVVAHGMERVP